MKQKLLFSLLALFMSLCSWATEVKFDFNSSFAICTTYSKTVGSISLLINDDGIAGYSSHMSLSGENSSIKLSASAGYAITKVEISLNTNGRNCYGLKHAYLYDHSEENNYEGPTLTWTGFGWPEVYTSAEGVSEVEWTCVKSYQTPQITSIKVTYKTTATVTLNTAGMATFSAGADAVIKTAGVKAYKAAVADNTITLTELTGYIPAGVGVLLYGTPSTEVTFNAPSTEAAAGVSDNVFLPTTLSTGALADIPGTGKVWALSGNLFQRFTGEKFSDNRAYLVTPSDAKELAIEFDGETTGISHVENDVNVENAGNIYNLAGQRVGADYKGIVIVNGKKVLR